MSCIICPHIAKLNLAQAPAVLSFSLILSFSDPPTPPGKSCLAQQSDVVQPSFQLQQQLTE